jgi:hypothetical protein
MTDGSARPTHWTSEWGTQLSILHSVQTGSGAHKTSYIRSIEGFNSPVVKPSSPQCSDRLWEVSGVSITLWPLYHRGKKTLYQLGMRLGGPHSQSGQYIEERNILSLPRIESRFHCPPTRLPSRHTDCAIPVRHGDPVDMSGPKLGKPTFRDYKFC